MLQVLFEHFPFDTVFQVFLSIVCGGLVGFERERSGKGAGLRTNILICLGSTLITHVSVQFSTHFGVDHSDPARIAAQIVSGVGFLGAGTILRAGGGVVGLTTAATIWAMAGVGLALGAGFYWDAIIATVGVYITLTLISRIRVFAHPETGHKQR